MTTRMNGLIGCLLLGIIFSLSGCGDQEGDLFSWGKKEKPEATGTLDDEALSTLDRNAEAMEGTVGEITYIQGNSGLRLRGYGLVAGLPGTGGMNCPPEFRDYVAREIRRARSANREEWPRAGTDELIDSPNSAVVMIEAMVPPGSIKGRRFDVHVTAVDLDTSSIAGGMLLPCDLRIFNPEMPQLEGKVHGQCEGTVFVNPFVGKGDNTTVINPREGIIIGGGANLIDRRLSLVAMYESYSVVRQIETVVNQRFRVQGADKVADGLSSTTVQLTIPEDFVGHEMEFVELVRHLPLSTSRLTHEQRATTLIGQLAQPESSWEDIALSLEGLGKSIVSILQQYYTDQRPHLSYYTARVGVRLDDETAVPVVARHARDERSPFRFQAIRELGNCNLPGAAGVVLRDLLADENANVRIEAYEALRKVDPHALESFAVGHDPLNFILDVVPSDGPTMIYARRSETRRLAVIGGDQIFFRAPILYSEPGKPLTLSADRDQAKLTIVRKDKMGNFVGEPIRADLGMPVWRVIRFMGSNMETNIDKQLMGLGVDYASIIEVLYRMCAAGEINAEMRWEEPSIESLIGPLTPLERPEAEM